MSAPKAGIEKQSKETWRASRENNARAILCLFLALYFLAFFAFALLSYRPAFLSVSLLAAWLGAGLGVTLVFSLFRSDSNRALLFGFGLGVLADIAFNLVAAKFGEREVAHFLFIALANVGVLSAASALGVLVARGLQKPNYLVMAAIVGALTDIFSVYAGPSKHMISSSAFPYFSYQWGVIGQGIIPCVGAGDFIFVALYFAGARRFGLNERKTLIAMLLAFGAGFFSLLFIPRGVPALPFLSAFLLLVHWRELKTQINAEGN